MNEFVSIADLADLADIPNSTCRRYLTTFEPFFVSKGGNRLKKYEVTAVAILKRIKAFYDDGMDTNEIFDTLTREFPIIHEISDEEGKELGPSNYPALATTEDLLDFRNEIIHATKEAMGMVFTQLVEVSEQNKELKQEIQQTKADFERTLEIELEKREQVFLEKLEENQKFYEKKFEVESLERQKANDLRESLNKRSEEQESKIDSVKDVLKTEFEKSSEKQEQQLDHVKDEITDIKSEISKVMEMVSSVKEVAATKEEPKKKGFWSRLRG